MSTAVRFDAASDRLLRTSGLLDYKQAYTVMLHVYVVTDLNDYGVIYTVNDGLFFQNYEYVGFDADGLTWRLASKHNNGSEITATGSTATAGTWYHLALVRSAANGTLTLYVDGVQDCQLTNDVSTGGGTLERMEIGAISQSDFSRVDARAAYARAWQTALTAGELATEMAAASAQKASPWGDWPLQSDYADISGNGRDWTASGTLTFEDGPTLSGGGASLKRRALRLGTRAGVQQGMH